MAENPLTSEEIEKFRAFLSEMNKAQEDTPGEPGPDPAQGQGSAQEEGAPAGDGNEEPEAPMQENQETKLEIELAAKVKLLEEQLAAAKKFRSAPTGAVKSETKIPDGYIF